MEIINNIVNVANNFLWSYVLVIALLVLGIYFTLRSGGVQFRYFTEMIRLMFDGESSKEAKQSGKITSLQAFSIATASRVGTGNIAGIAIAIVLGGPGAIFWMWVMALIGGASSFVESTLAQIYKVSNGSYTKGGPAFYIEQALGMKWLGSIFAIILVITYPLVFNSVQANTIALAFSSSFNVSQMTVGIIVTILSGLVIFGGSHRIAKVSEIIVPVFAGLYILVAIGITIANITELPRVLNMIVVGAFKPKQFAVGTGAGIMTTLLTGVKRGMFSNEAGMGSAPNAAAAAYVQHPVKQGLIQAFSVFTDTLIICSCSAFMILLFDGYASSGKEGIELAQLALTSHIGRAGGLFLLVCIFLFAISSIVGNTYYGESNLEFITNNKIVMFLFRVSVCFMVFFGSIQELGTVWNMADLSMAIMSIINLFAIALLSKYAMIALKDYTRQKKAGIKDPVFSADGIKGLENTEYWHNGRTN